MRLRAARVPAVAAVASVLAIVVSGCSQPAFTYIANKDRDVVLRIPRDWSPVSTDAVLKADGQDPSASDYGWLVFYDADAKPSTTHLRSDSVEHPVMIAQSLDIGAQNRANLTADTLRNLLQPVTADARASDEISRSSMGLAPREFTMISDQTVKTKTERGVHVVFSYQTGSRTEFYDQIAVTDPKRTRAHVVMVHCSQACFQANHKQIDDAVDSLTVKKT